MENELREEKCSIDKDLKKKTEKEQLLKDNSKKSVENSEETDSSFFNVLVLSFGLMFLFLAFTTCQGYTTTIHADIGNLCLGILYFTFSVSNFITPVVVFFLGDKMSIILGGLSYIFFIFVSGLEGMNWLLITASFFVGLTAPLLWSAHGSILVLSSGRKLSSFSGVFWGIFQTNSFFGFLISGLCLHVIQLSQFITFMIFGWIGMFGIFLFFFLRDIKTELHQKQKEEERKRRKTTHEKQQKSTTTTTTTIINHGDDDDEEEEEENEKEDEKSPSFSILEDFASRKKKNDSMKNFLEEFRKLVSNIFATVYVLCDIRFILLESCFLYNGYSYGFYFGTITQKFGYSLISWTFALFAVVEFCGSIFFGKLIECFGTRNVYYTTFLIHFVSIVYTFTLDFGVVFYFVTIGICGLGDSGLNTIIYSMVGRLFEKKTAAAAISAFKFIQSIAISFQFLTDKVFSFFQIQIILLSLILCSVVSFCLLDLFIYNENDEKEEEEEKEKEEE